MTNISVDFLNNLIEKIKYCICYDVYWAVRDKSNLSVIDIGIGQLAIKITNDEIQYKFIPSEVFEKDLIDSVNGNYKLTYKLEKSLKEKIEKIYKEIL